MKKMFAFSIIVAGVGKDVQKVGQVVEGAGKK